jgi:7-cyano-7-deazaguanine reductase
VPRTLARNKTGISEPLPFKGEDIWNAYEISWLNQRGKPEIALAEFTFPCTSPNIVESKSFKLYLNSFNQSNFESMSAVEETIRCDLSNATGGNVEVKLYSPSHFNETSLIDFTGICLDTIDTDFSVYQVDPSFLKTSQDHVQEVVYSDLFKSNCLATGQPDWGSLWIHYVGNQINHEGLLKYFVSFRDHSGFAEHCVEQVFSDIMKHCNPEKLTVYARYTRRGGLDINPFRSNFESSVPNMRQVRQ